MKRKINELPMNEIVRIAIIDSGINQDHPELSSLRSISGCGFEIIDDKVNEINTYQDQIGHGTAVAAIISKTAPSAHYFCLRIFDQRLSCDVRLLVAAVEKAIEIKADIIHFSLGITSIELAPVLKEACDQAAKNGIILISAANNEGEISYPAHWSNVIGVESDSNLAADHEFDYLTQSPIEIRAKGRPQKVAWVNPAYIYQGGNSFAAPYITGIVARFLSSEGKLDLGVLHKLLKEYSRHIIGLEEDISIEYNRIHMINKVGKKIENARKIFCRDAELIKKAVVFPFSKEMHQLIRFADKLPFELVKVLDVRYSGYVGVNPSQIIPECQHDSPIMNIDKINEIIHEFDTIIIGHTHELSVLIGRDLTKELLSLAIKNNKNIYCLDDLTVPEYNELTMEAINKGLTFTYPFVDFNDLDYYKLRTKKLQKISKPVIGIFGTGPHQGKFTTQLLLKYKFEEQGYGVGQLGSEHQSLLMGFDEVFPMGYNSNVFVGHSIYIPILNQQMRRIDDNPETNVIIVGAQSGTIPYDFLDFKHQTFPTLAFLSGTMPDLIVLHINYLENITYIKRTISVIENFSQSRVIACVLYGKSKRINPLNKVIYADVSSEDLKLSIDSYRNELDLPVFNTLLKEDVDSLYDTILSYL